MFEQSQKARDLKECHKMYTRKWRFCRKAFMAFAGFLTSFVVTATLNLNVTTSISCQNQCKKPWFNYRISRVNIMILSSTLPNRKGCSWFVIIYNSAQQENRKEQHNQAQPIKLSRVCRNDRNNFLSCGEKFSDILFHFSCIRNSRRRVICLRKEIFLSIINFR